MNSTAHTKTPALDRAPWPRSIVTGASSGLGLALATQLAEAGVPVIAIARSGERLNALAARLPLVEPVVADLADLAALPALAHRLVSRHPDIGLLINNAGIQHAVRMDDASYGPAQIDEEIRINLSAPMVLAQALLPQLQSRQRAWIVNIGSGLALAPKRSAAVYSASKAGLRLFTQALRVQLRGSGVHVVDVLLPLVDTPMTAGRGRHKLAPEAVARELMAALRAGREDIAIGPARALPLLQRWAPSVLAKVLQRD